MKQKLTADDFKFHNRQNCFVFEMDGFDRFVIIVNDFPKEHHGFHLIQSKGFCPHGMRWIYENFMLDFIFKDVTISAQYGTVCKHNLKND